MRRYLIAGVLTGSIVAAIYAAPALTQGRPAAPAVRIQAGDGGTLGLAHTIRVEGAAAPSLDGGIASIYVAAGAGGVLDVKADEPLYSSSGQTPTLLLIPCPAPGQLLKSDGGTWYCADDLDTNTTYSAGNQLTLNGTTFNVTEGASSGLDADKLDGLEPSAMAVGTAAALAANPTDCTAGQFATSIAANGNLGCATVQGSQVSGAVATASALAANPADCSAGQYATAIAASGNLTCATPADHDSLGALSCADGQMPYWNEMGGEWACGDPPSGTVPTCSTGQILKSNGTGWSCASQFTTSTCTGGQVAIGINSAGGVVCATLYVNCGGTSCSYNY